MYRSPRPSSLTTFCALAVLSLPTTSALAQGVDQSSPLIEKVRHATARFLNINVALAEGWVPATPCVSGPDTGAMGVHLVFPPRLDEALLDATQPEALIYEPAALEGTLLNYVGEPNRFGLPAFYELHAWAWEHNPMGSFADWNTYVTCNHQPVSAAGTATR